MGDFQQRVLPESRGPGSGVNRDLDSTGIRKLTSCSLLNLSYNLNTLKSEKSLRSPGLNGAVVVQNKELRSSK